MFRSSAGAGDREGAADVAADAAVNGTGAAAVLDNAFANDEVTVTTNKAIRIAR